MKPDYRIYYCKGLKKTGKPIIVKLMKSGKEKNVKSINMKNVDIRMSFNNSPPAIKRRGATTILEVYKK